MRRLYWRIYLGFVAVVVLFAIFVAGLRLLGADDERERLVEAVADTVGELLPAPAAPHAELESALARLSERFSADVAVFAADGTRLAAAGDALPSPEPGARSGWVHGRDGHGFALTLPDGRTLVARRRGPGRHDGAGWLAILAALALAIAIGAYPLARRITRRLERLQRQVDALGAGELSARVDVDGRDEVAELARSFNRSAERIERLVAAQRATLASASHELRSPLARIRLAVELASDGARPDLVERIEADIGELDDLIDELLLASRMQAGAALDADGEIDLHALLVDEAERVGATVHGAPVTVSGDARLLRRLLRNLLENAARHGAGAPIDVSLVPRDGDTVEIRVDDRGPGVEPALRERIFEPFFRPPGLREGRDRGVGLGLALVREVARHHGGDAVCEARDGGGSRLRAWIATRRP